MKHTLPSASVAVITRTKDRPELVRRAMESVLGQTYQDWVHIIVNDGGEKEPLEVLARSYGDAYRGRLHIVHHDSSKGMQNASNAGLDASESEYVTIHDDDDSWTTQFLAKTVEAIECGEPNRKVDGAVSQSTRIFEEITFGGNIRELKRSEYYYFEFANLNEMRRRNLFPPIAFVYRRKAHEHVGKFKQDYDVLGDHDFNLRFLRHYNITVLKEYLANYHWRMHAQGNTVTRGVEKHRFMLDRLKNDYLREALSGSTDAVGDLDAIQFPPAGGSPVAPFEKRTTEAPEPEAFPDPFTGEDFKCLSLDVFDTALLRQCNLPADVFKIVEVRIPQEIKSLSTLPFALARTLAEDKARQTLEREVTLEEIYAECGPILGITPKEADAIKALELTIEEEVLYAHPRTLAIAQKATDLGKEVIYVSDMYLSATCIQKWLQQAGYPKGKVFVSCEIGDSKHTGALYPLVLKQIPFQASEIVHIGDNLNSDFVQAKAHGLRALHLHSRAVTQPWCDEIDPFVENPSDNLSRLFAGLVRRRHHEEGFADTSLLYRLGYELAGPLYLSYLRWVASHAKQNGIQRLLLLGRDGYYLEKALKEIGKDYASEIEFTYIEASRKTLCFASFESLEEVALDFLSTPHPSLCAADFLTRLGLDWKNYSDTIITCGFADPLAIITKSGGGDFFQGDTEAKLKQLFHLIRPELEELFAEDRKAYTFLFEHLSFDAKTDAIVDLGWAASSAKALSNFLKTEASQPLTAYYFGTWENAVSEDNAFCAHGYFMGKGGPSDHASLLNESINWLEALFSAPFQTLLNLKIEDGDVKPVYSTDKGTGFSAVEQKDIWSGAKAFLATTKPFAALPTSSTDGWSYIALTLRRLLTEPSPAELNTWGHLEHSDGFGLEMHRPLIMPVESNAAPKELLEAYDTSTWKRGFLSTISVNQVEFVLERRYPQPAKTYEELQGEVLWLKQKQDELWAKYSAFESTAQNRLEALNSLTESNERLQKTNQEQAQNWENNQAEIKRLQGIINDSNSRLQSAQSANASLTKSNQEQAEAWKSNQAEIKRLSKLISEQTAALEDINKSKAALEDGYSQTQIKLESQLNEALKSRTSLQNEFTEMSDAKTSLQNELTEMSDAKTSLQNELTEMSDAKTSLENAYNEMSDAKTSLENAYNELNERRERLQNEIDIFNSLTPFAAMKTAWKRKKQTTDTAD
tara:strand:+ start:8986 stop:12594 length:3609 start_codon:yes stop_codon:yes gene_type:complete